MQAKTISPSTYWWLLTTMTDADLLKEARERLDEVTADPVSWGLAELALTACQDRGISLPQVELFANWVVRRALLRNEWRLVLGARGGDCWLQLSAPHENGRTEVWPVTSRHGLNGAWSHGWAERSLQVVN